MTLLRELIDRVSKMLGFSTREPQAASDPAPASPAGLAEQPAPETEA